MYEVLTYSYAYQDHQALGNLRNDDSVHCRGPMSVIDKSLGSAGLAIPVTEADATRCRTARMIPKLWTVNDERVRGLMPLLSGLDDQLRSGPLPHMSSWSFRHKPHKRWIPGVVTRISWVPKSSQGGLASRCSSCSARSPLPTPTFRSTSSATRSRTSAEILTPGPSLTKLTPYTKSKRITVGGRG